MTRTPAEIRELISELRGFAQACGAREAGDGAFAIRTLTGSETDQTEMNLRSVLRGAADALAPLAAERGEVVAYRYDFPGGRCSTELGFEPLDDEARNRGWIETLLYAHPAPPAPAAMSGAGKGKGDE